MVPWWKRLIYSLVGAVLGAGLSGGFVAAQQFISSSHGRVSAIGLMLTVLSFDVWVVALSLPAWGLAVPVVLMVRDIRGWRFWVYLGLGACFGPALILGIALYSALRAPNFAGFPGDSMSVAYMAGAISLLTTAIYLLLLRAAQMRLSAREKTAVVGS